MGSSRLPGKVLLELEGAPVLEHVVSRVQKAGRVDLVAVATTHSAGDDPIVAWCEQAGVPYYRGDEHDVLARYVRALDQFPAAAVVRITADCPAIDPGVIDKAIDVFEASSADYAGNTRERTFPHGLDVEVVRSDVLKEAHERAELPAEREHVTP